MNKDKKTIRDYLSQAKSISTASTKAILAYDDPKKQLALAESGELPDVVLRAGMRQLIKKRLKEEFASDPELQQQKHHDMIQTLKESPLAIETDKANEQHYEVPTDFYLHSLGKNLKYSSAYYPEGCDNLDEAEDTMLAMYVDRAGLEDDMTILELGCGWGSFTLWMAKRLPNAQITGVSNSATQKQHIMSECEKHGLSNVTIITQDVNNLTLDDQFDRVVSIEMFEHVRNYQQLFHNIANWLKPEGKLFTHIFCHRTLLYPFEVKGEDDWMSKYFFSGGLMPSSDTFLHFQDDLKLEKRWHVDGTHYEKTANHWLELTDKNKEKILDIFQQDSSTEEAKIWLQRWRMFFMACAELFGYKKGSEWIVAHYLFEKRNNR